MTENSRGNYLGATNPWSFSAAEGPICSARLEADLSPPIFGLEHVDPMRLSPVRNLKNNLTHCTWRYKGRLDKTALVRAANEVARRHRILQCTLRHSSGTWNFHAQAAEPDFSSFDDTGTQTRSEAESRAIERVCGVVWRPFFLLTESPFRVVSVKIAEDDYLVAFAISHAHSDGYSVRLCSYELGTLYHAFRRGLPSPLEEPECQFFDYMASLDEWCRGTEASESMTYWLRYMDGAHTPNLSISDTIAISRRMNHEISRGLQTLSRTERIGMATVWSTVHQVARWKLLGQTDVTTIPTVAGRRQRNIMNMIGPFTDHVLLRTQIDPDCTFRETLRGIARSRFSSLPYESLPLLRVPIPNKYNFGTTNYLPANFHCMPTLGALVDLPEPSILYSAGGEGEGGYNLIIRDGAHLDLKSYAWFSGPLQPIDMLETVALIAQAAAVDPDSRLRSLVA